MSSTVLWLIMGVLAVAVVLYWLLTVTEGVYLGSRTVIWLYDRIAPRYDAVKQYMDDWEASTLAEPILQRLEGVDRPLILDVATGTGRLARTLFAAPNFQGCVVGLDLSRNMLNAAAHSFQTRLPAHACAPLLHHTAEHLPFADASFDVVACLEALEFMPHPERVIAELVRVMRTGGLLVLTNRKGYNARLMPFKTYRLDHLARLLQEKYGLEDVSYQIWQIEYDLLWAYQTGQHPDHAVYDPYAVMRCPVCDHIGFDAQPTGLHCAACNHWIPVSQDGVIDYIKSVQMR